MKSLSAALAVVLLPACIAAQDSAIERAARSISASDFAYRVGVIAHDSMQGRDTPSPGLDATAEWATSEFRRMGLRGGAERGSFIQRYPLRTLTVDAAHSRMAAGSTVLQFGRDLVPLRGGPGGESTGGVVLISGSTFSGPELVEAVRDRHAIVVRAANTTGMSRPTLQLVFGIIQAGAASVSITVDGDDATWDGLRSLAMRPSVQKGWGDTPASVAGPFRPMLQMRMNALERLVAGQNIDLVGLQARAGSEVQAQVVWGLEATLTVRAQEGETTAPNVVAILDGSDPELLDEYVVYSAHMDHVGVGEPDENGDTVFNGADDDASGTAAIIEVAEAMASLPTAPRRSQVFLLVSGEEKGLWGSEWFAENPTVPVEQLVANLNADMVGRNWTDTIVAIGKEHSDLGETLNAVNEAHPELRMTAIDDIWPEERFYFRSDHYNFARKGVPILFFFNGTHEDYHGRDDEPDKIDAEKAARIARLLFYMGLEVGNADARPEWNPESYARIVSDR